MCIYENIGKQSLLCKYTSYPERLKGCVGDLPSSVFVALFYSRSTNNNM